MLYAPFLDKDIAHFIQRGVSIHVASCSAEQFPSIARALGCRLSNDGRAIVLYLSAASSAPLLEDLRNNRAISAVFSQPTTLQSLQIKGRSVEFVPFGETDLAVMMAYREAFVSELCDAGQREEFARAIVPQPDADVVAISFMPTAVYVQTPGPMAGDAVAGFA